MGFSIADIIASAADTFAPFIVVELAIYLHVRAAQSNFLAVNTWEVSFAADPGAKTNVERVIPDIKFPNIRSIAHGKKIDSRDRLAVRSGHFVSDIDHILIGPD